MIILHTSVPLSVNNGFLFFLLVLSPFSFSIGDTTGLEPYLHGGIAVLVKTPKTFYFVSIFFFSCLKKFLSLQKKNGRRGGGTIKMSSQLIKQ